MNGRIVIAWVAALLVSAAAFAASNMSKITYLEYKCLEGIELTHYVFTCDKRGTAWLIHVTDDTRANSATLDATRANNHAANRSASLDANFGTSPRKKASKELIQSLQSLIEEGDVFSYAPEYEPAEAVCGGAKWELEVRLKDGRSVHSSGHAAEPPKSILDSLALLFRSYLY